MTIRYYQLKDAAMLEEVKKQLALLEECEKNAKAFAEKHGLGTPGFSSWHIFDARIGGFRPNNSQLEKDGWFVNPKKGYTWPRAKKGSPILAEYKELCMANDVDDSKLHEVLGWKTLDYFPSIPGCYWSLENDQVTVVFSMPEHVDKVPGCIEISNIEFKAIKDGVDAGDAA